MSNLPVPIVSLFCGPGGMDLGFRQEGFRLVLALDDSQAAIETYNFNESRGCALKRNLSELSGADLVRLVRAASPDQPPRGVIGGPPCQSFSPGNRQKKRHDPRARLGLDFARLLQALNEEFQLDFFVFENVAGLRCAAHNHRFRRGSLSMPQSVSADIRMKA